MVTLSEGETPDHVDVSQFELQLMALHADGTSKPVLLQRWLKFDFWTPSIALPILIGLDPDDQTLARFVEDLPDGSMRTAALMSARYLDWSLICIEGHKNHMRYLRASDEEREAIHSEGNVPITSLILLELKVKLNRLEELWASGKHPERASPDYFIAWAQSKGFDIPWIEWACNEGLLPHPAPAEASPTSPVQVQHSAEVSKQHASLSTDEIANIFGASYSGKTLTKWDVHAWKRNLEDTPAWLKGEDCKLGDGQRGNRHYQSAWNPLGIALRLKNEQAGKHSAVPANKLDYIFRTEEKLNPWRDEWRRQREFDDE